MRYVVWGVGVAALGLIAAGQGCGGNVVVDKGGKTTGVQCTTLCDGGVSDGYYDGYYDGGADGADGVDGGISCFSCACDYLSGDQPPGCADTCDNTISGAANPNFCNGANALPQCTACIMDRCGETPQECL